MFNSFITGYVDDAWFSNRIFGQDRSDFGKRLIPEKKALQILNNEAWRGNRRAFELFLEAAQNS